ncbi:Inactive rhomboid protein 1 [Glycine soja]|uniref:RHOMBOID-like protein n=1 Tax=Glycine soja TaxID=3848 RepID=A0A0B2RDT5_GLYSO|nr:Inactive rhomboid protein 1 [Glycine soja]
MSSTTRRDLESGGANKNYNNISYSAAPTSYVYDPEVHWTSWLVPLFVAVNVVVFVVAMYLNDCPRKNLGFEGECVASLTKMGALRWDDVVNHHQAWRLVTCIWLHAGVVHLAANMLSLVFIGIRLEQQFGFVRIGIIYLLSGFGGSVLSSLFIRNNISVGASGALFGLLGAMLSELITNWSIYTNKAAALFTLLFIIVINLAIGMLPHVDNFAHIGGFLTGFLLGFILLLRPQFGWLEQRRPPAGVRLKSKYKAYQYVLWIVSAILLIVGLSIALVMLFRGENGYDHCHWCHYLTCVPTSKWKCNDN